MFLSVCYSAEPLSELEFSALVITLTDGVAAPKVKEKPVSLVRSHLLS